MASQHKRNPVTFRPGIEPGDPDGDREWLLAYAGETGRPVGAIVSEALAKYRENAESHPGMAVTQSPETTGETK